MNSFDDLTDSQDSSENYSDFPKIFLDFRLNWIESLSQTHAYVVLSNSKVAFLGKEENVTFFYFSIVLFFYRQRCIIRELCR